MEGFASVGVQRLCEGNSIEGVLNINQIWLIPKNTEKPVDGRKKNARVDK